ncbi:MAG: YfhO family protein [Melioribacteraceae bacterium]|nr:YfhO family protein [Melioribacteraceae bacterium]
MSKTKRTKVKISPSVKSKSILEILSKKQTNFIAVVIILIPLLYYFLPWLIDGDRPIGTDLLGSIGQTHRWVEWAEETGETALWNPSIFGGEPIYSRLTPKLIHIDSLLQYLNQVSYWVFWYLFLGGVGLFFFLKYKKIPWYVAVIVAVAFVLLPDWQAQIGEGHNSKLRAIMTLPWLFLSFSYFFDKNNWLGVGLFAFAFSWLVRTHHFQIVFYGILVLFVLYIYPTVKMMIDKKFKETGSLFLKFAVALLLTFMTAAQPLFTTNEYAEYSTRGGNPVKLGAEASSATEGGGVSFEYATQWSFSPRELMSFFIPRYNGGLQGEVYDGDKYPQLKGQRVPGYWGDKPFNGNYASMGMILFLFAIVGVVYFRKDKFVAALAAFVIFSLLLSFGRHLPELYKLFFYYLPFFSKFRAPAMLVNITFLIILVLSGYGIKGIIQNYSSKDLKWITSIFGGAIVLTIGILLFSDSFAYTIAAEAGRYDANTLNAIKDIRKEFLIADTQKLLIYLILATVVTSGFLFKKIKLELFVLLILILSAAEIFSISNRAHKLISLDDPEKLEESVFKPTPITDVLTKAAPTERAIVLGKDFTSNHYAYFYPLISGYSAIKLQVIQDVIAHNLYKANTSDGINWNLINMLGGKYIISSAQINSDSLKTIAMNQNRKEILYLNPGALSKAWFVKEAKAFATPEDVVIHMNKAEFDPSTEALIVSKNASKTYSGNGSIELLSQTPNSLEFNVDTDSTQFFVLSEIYYPKGWIAKLDDKELDILKVNHLLRGVEVEPGKHKLIFEFHPQTYYSSVTAIWIGNVLIWLLILGGGYFVFKKEKSINEN